jgi:hypothetical protein
VFYSRGKRWSEEGWSCDLGNSPAFEEGDPAPGSRDATAYLKKLERLVLKLLGGRFAGAKSIWKLQLDLLRLERDIQKDISQLKVSVKKDERLRPKLESLRQARWHARRFGDAIAWILLGLDRQVIYPLAFNQAVSIPPEDDGSRGMVVIAEALASRGWGFPLLHDITDLLRIGDITFIRPDEEPRTRTVEIKTRLKNKRPAERGLTTLEYEVTVLMAVDDFQPEIVALESEGESDRTNNAAKPPRSSPRITRQLTRLDTARARQRLEDETITEIAGARVISVRSEIDHRGYGDVVQRVARKARRVGYASETVENAFLYVSLYDQEGLDPKRDESKFQQISKDLVASGIFYDEEKERNSLVIYSVPHAQPSAQLFLPYYLYSLPKTTIIDMLHGRMMLFIFVNSGRIVSALEEQGFEVEFPTGRNDLANESLVASWTYDIGKETYRGQLHNLGIHIHEMIMEFRSVQYLVTVAETMRDASWKGIRLEKKTRLARDPR